MEKLQKFLNKLQQPSTKAGILAFAGLFGIVIPVDVITSGVIIIKGISGAIAGGAALYEIFRDEDKRKDKELINEQKAQK